jgi:hypothetical protein
MDLLNNYSEQEIDKMVKVYEQYKKTNEYRKNYYRKKYNDDPVYRNKKQYQNRVYMRKVRDQQRNINLA